MSSPAPTPHNEPITDEAAFRVVFDDGWGVVHAVLRGLLPPGVDVEDVASDAFAIAWRRRAEIPHPPGSRAWLVATARLVARNHLRAERRRAGLVARVRERIRPADLAHHAPPPSSDDDPPGPATAALALLRPADREVLVLHAWGDLTLAQLAETLGVSTDTAGKRLQRARTRLARQLVVAPDDPAPTASTAGVDR